MLCEEAPCVAGRKGKESSQAAWLLSSEQPLPVRLSPRASRCSMTHAGQAGTPSAQLTSTHLDLCLLYLFISKLLRKLGTVLN